MKRRIKAMFGGSTAWQPITDAMRARFAESSNSGAVADYCPGAKTDGFHYARCVSQGDEYSCSIWEIADEVPNV